MAASLGEPLTLSKHDILSKTTSLRSSVVASCSRASKADCATLGIQDEGITIIDLTTLQPEAAALLGPDSAFECAPVSRTVENEQEKHIRQTYSVTSTTKDSSSRLHGDTIVSWSSKESLTSLERLDTITLELSISSLYAPQWMQDTVIAVAPDGSITLCDAKLQQATKQSTPSTSKKLLFSFLFDAADCQFASTQATSTNGAILISILKDARGTYLRRSTIGASTAEMEDVQLSLPKLNLNAASCDKSGCLALLGDDGTLFPFLIERSQDGLTVSPLEKLSLQNLEASTITTLCLGSTHVLVAGVTKSDSDIALLLWDVRFSVLLAQRRTVIPSTLSSLPSKQVTLQCVSCNESQSLLVICPSLSRSRSKSSSVGLKSVVMVLPHVIPPTSSLANAIGKASEGEVWLKLSDARAPEVDGVDEDRKEILQRIIDALRDGTAEQSDKVFFEWLEEQRMIAKNAAREEAKRQLAALHGPTHQMNGKSGKESSSDSGEEKATRHGNQGRVKHIRTQVQFDHAFLKRLLEALFQPTSLQPGKYSSKIPTYLLERKLISDSMHEEGVLHALQERNDWESIRWALRNTVDIPEDQLISLVRHTANLQTAKSADAMDVDETTSKMSAPLSLSQVLGHVVAYPISAPPLRLALRKHFSRAEDALVLLKILNEWIIAAGIQSASIKFSNVEDAGKEDANPRGLSKKGTPRLDMVVNFLSCLLDATLLELLQYRPAHDILQSMSERITPQLSYLDDLEKLRGPLEPFVQADRKGKRTKEDGTFRKQQRRHEIKAQSHALTVDLYEIEEFFL